MKSMFKLAILLIFAITISCDSETLSEPDGVIQASKSANAQKVTKNFTNSLTGTATGFYGIMTHVGKYTGVDNVPPTYEPIDELTGIQSGDETITAANGDKIYTLSTSLITFGDATYTFGTYTGTWKITGGTGRFAGATGSATINNGVFGADGINRHNSVGTITY